MLIQTALSSAASLVEATCALRWTIRRSTISSTVMNASRAAHSHNGVWKSTKSVDEDSEPEARNRAGSARSITSYRVSLPPAPSTAWAAASRAIGTRNGEQLT